MSIQITY